MAFESIEGKKVPTTNFKIHKDGSLSEQTYEEVFSGKRVVIFALPGAYTPTCSSTHLPRYNELAKVIKKQGIDDIYVLSVNDPFVMSAWIKDQNAEHLKTIADGNGEFSAGLGLLVDKTDLGFGKRSWRYSMVVKDGVVEKAFIEPEKPGDPFEVSDADTMLKYLNDKATPPKSITLFTRPGCPHCLRAKEIFKERDESFNEIVLGRDTNNSALFAITGKTKVPQIFIDGQHIGGRDDLEKLYDLA